MKTLRLIVLGAVLAESLLLLTANAQVYSSRRLTRRIAPQLNTNHTGAAAQPGGPAQTKPASPVPAPSATARPVPTQPLVRIVQPVQDPEKVREAKEAALRRTVEFQKKRAEEGSESAQYELGVRYLKGDGVEKDEVQGRKWLNLSAKNGYSLANKKLEELDKPVAPAKPPASK